MPPAPAPAPPLPQGTGREEVSGHAARHTGTPRKPSSHPPQARAGPLGSARGKDPPTLRLSRFGGCAPALGSRSLPVPPPCLQHARSPAARPVPEVSPRPQSHPTVSPAAPSPSPAPPICPRGVPWSRRSPRMRGEQERGRKRAPGPERPRHPGPPSPGGDTAPSPTRTPPAGPRGWHRDPDGAPPGLEVTVPGPRGHNPLGAVTAPQTGGSDPAADSDSSWPGVTP